jgi:hypothetical protein
LKYYRASYGILSDFHVSLLMSGIMPPDKMDDPFYRTYPR